MLNKISVIGSINMDIVVQVEDVPKSGETIVGKNFSLIPGGKGSNQAVAACKSGIATSMYGCVGEDIFGDIIISQLSNMGIDTSKLDTTVEESTGIANVILDREGENRIIIIPGSNNSVTVEYVNKCWEKIKGSSLILLQHEIPLETIHYVIRKAKQNEIQIILNPAPFYEIPSDILSLVDYLILNEIEAEALLCMPIKDKESAIRAANHFSQNKKEINNVIITLGEKGSVLINKHEHFYQPALKVEVKDTTDAGDTFVGSFAASIMSGKSKKILYDTQVLLLH